MKSTNPNGRTPTDISKRRFERLLVISYAGRSRWHCLCDCGELTIVATCNLNNHHTRSCGCLNSENTSSANRTHGHTVLRQRTTTWQSWYSMIRRCSDPNREDYPLYGGRGIQVDVRWLSFPTFLADMGEKPTGKNLFQYDPSGSLKVNLEYDIRQEATVTLKQMGITVQNNKASYDLSI